MSIRFTSLTFIWLLYWTAESTGTSNKTLNFTTEGNGNVPVLTHNLSTSKPPTEASGHTFMQPTIADAKPTVKTTSKTFLTNMQTAMQTAAMPTSAKSSQLTSTAVSEKSKTEVQFNATKSAPSVTSHASNSSTVTSVPLEVSSFTQSQSTDKTSTIQFTSDQTTKGATIPAQITQLISTITTSTKPPDKSASTSPKSVTMATTKTPFIYTTKATTTEDAQQGKTDAMGKNGTNHGKTVAGLIGGALLLMIVGFLVIFVRKRRFQKQQVSTTEWAGPSPFLEGGADNDQVTHRSSNRISLSSFLPQRLSKRLSLLPETEEELEDMTSRTTFGDQHQGCTFGREANRDDAKKSNGTAVGAQEIKGTGDAPETAENSASVNSSPTNNVQSTNDNSDTAEENLLVEKKDDLK